MSLLSGPSPVSRPEAHRSEWDSARTPSGGSQPASPFLIPGETPACPAVHLVSWQWDDCYSAAVAIFIFQLSQEKQGSNIYILAFYSERTVTKITRGGFSQSMFLDLPVKYCCAIRKSFSAALSVIMGEMRNKMYVQELLLGYCHPSHTALRTEPAPRLRFTIKGFAFNSGQFLCPDLHT